MWLDDLLTRIDFKQWYPQGKATGNEQIITNCQFHEDKHASLSINLRTGLYYCHACSEKGNFLSWCKHKNIDLKGLAKEYGIEVEQKLVAKKYMEEAHQKLLDSNESMQWLTSKRGLKKATIIKHQLGLYKRHITIPVFDINDKLVNIRLYNPRGKGQTKMLSWSTGYGSARLFPIKNIYEDQIMLCEGEMDAMLANQLGYNAITGTTGAGTFKTSWIKYFTGKKVLICYDIDSQGKSGAKRVAGMLGEVVDEIKIIYLPIDPKEIPNGDLTDYVVSLGNNKSNLDDLISRTSIIEISKPEEIKYEEVLLHEATHAKYSGKYIKTKGIISGKDIASFIIPKKIKYSCSMDYGSASCAACNMTFDNGERTEEINLMDEVILSLFDCTKEEAEKNLKRLVEIPPRCSKVKIKPEKTINVEVVQIVPEIKYSVHIDKDTKFVTSEGNYLGHDIETNRAYEFKAKTVAHPRTQYATHIIMEAKPTLTAVEGFMFTEEIHKKLIKQFKSDQVQHKINDIYDTTMLHVTGLKMRHDMFTAMMLAFCSPLHFHFESKALRKGWIETLVLGDTKTGKSEMAKSLIEYFKLGELVGAESTSFAGLIGGLDQQQGNRWQLKWGRIPLSHRRIVVIDEMSGLSTFDIGRLSGIRSSGIAEVTKIKSERTWAKTRLIWLSNIRGHKEDPGKMLANYTQGIKAVPELVGKAEDVSRFDIILLVDINEVPAHEINKRIDPPKTYKYKGTEFHDLILWAWKIKPDNIIFTDDAMKKIFETTYRLSEKYSQSIPVVVPSEQRIKIARLACATAVLTYSTDNGQRLIVEKHHVEFIEYYLQYIYDKPACSYNEYSYLEKSRYELKNIEDIKKNINGAPDVIDQLIDIDRITQMDIQEIFNFESKTDVRKFTSMMVKNKAFRRATNGYVKTPAFIKFLREHKYELKGTIDWVEEEDDPAPF